MSIASDLNVLTHLKRLYFKVYDFGEESSPSRDRRDIFASQARNLAQAVPSLVTITNVSALHQPYTAAKITRGENEKVVSVEGGDGCGKPVCHVDRICTMVQSFYSLCIQHLRKSSNRHRTTYLPERNAAKQGPGQTNCTTASRGSHRSFT